MEYSLRHAPVLDLSASEVKTLKHLTYRPDGMMAQALDNVRADKRGPESFAVIAENSAGAPLGWVLVFPNRHSSRFEAYFFVADEHRRQGIGTALAEAARRRKPRHKLMVRPGNQRAWNFFARFPQTRFEPQGAPYWLREVARGKHG